MVYGIKLVGSMEATYGDDGSVVLRATGDVVGPKHALKTLPRAVTCKDLHKDAEVAKFASRVTKAHPGAQGSTRSSERSFHIAKECAVLPKGGILLTHVSKIRLAG